MARAGRLLNPLHRAGKSLGERLLRKLQPTAEGRMLERRDLLFLKEARCPRVMTRLAICGDAFERRHAKPLHQSIETRKHGTLTGEPGKALHDPFSSVRFRALSEAAPKRVQFT
jgi:hypothetical protein